MACVKVDEDKIFGDIESLLEMHRAVSDTLVESHWPGDEASASAFGPRSSQHHHPLIPEAIS